MNEQSTQSLTATERAALARWAEPAAPDGFADRVMAAWEAEASGPYAGVGTRPVRDRRRVAITAAVSAVLAAAAVLALWVRASAEPPRPDALAAAAVADADIARLRADARDVLVRHCSPCHDGEARGAEAAAVQVFDVTVDAWWRMPTDDALPLINERLQANADATDAERARVSAFVAAELHHRG